jgi:cell division protein ZapA (FtsZ GTPase activity inhibitor)
MAVIDISIGKSKYKIDCPQSQQDSLVSLAHQLNERVNNLALSMRSADEKTLLVICALTIEEELNNLNKDSKKKSPLNSVEENNNQDNSQNLYNLISITKKIETIASAVEKLANKIKNY